MGHKREMFNLFHLQQSGAITNHSTNMKSPALHIRLGLINKFSKALDAVVRIWERIMVVLSACSKSTSPERSNFAISLSAVGMRHERYYNSEMS